MLTAQGAAAYSKTLHAIQWRHLLAKANGRHIFVREEMKGASQHNGHGVIRGVKNDATLIIQPDSGHKREEEVPITSTRLWWSKTVQNPMGGIPEDELTSILEEGANMVVQQENDRQGDLKETDIVIMDIGDGRFYAGSPHNNRYNFSDKVTEAQRYKKDGHASRSVKMLHRNEIVPRLISETGLRYMTVKQAWAVLKKRREMAGKLPNLRRLCDIPEANPQSIPELFDAAFPTPPLIGGKATNPPPPDRPAKIHNGKANGHAVVNPNGNGNGVAPANRMGELFGSVGMPVQTDVPRLDPSIYNAATVPVAIQEVDKEVQQAWRDVQESQAMLNDALTRYHASMQKKEVLLMAVQPQVMARAMQDQSLALQREAQNNLLDMLVKVASGQVPEVVENGDEKTVAPAADSETGSLITTRAMSEAGR